MENVLLTEEQRNLIIERLNSDLNQVVRERNRLYANRRNNRNDEEAFTANAARRDELSGNLRLISTYLPGRELTQEMVDRINNLKELYNIPEPENVPEPETQINEVGNELNVGNDPERINQRIEGIRNDLSKMNEEYEKLSNQLQQSYSINDEKERNKLLGKIEYSRNKIIEYENNIKKLENLREELNNPKEKENEEPEVENIENEENQVEENNIEKSEIDNSETIKYLEKVIRVARNRLKEKGLSKKEREKIEKNISNYEKKIETLKGTKAAEEQVKTEVQESATEQKAAEEQEKAEVGYEDAFVKMGGTDDFVTGSSIEWPFENNEKTENGVEGEQKSEPKNEVEVEIENQGEGNQNIANKKLKINFDAKNGVYSVEVAPGEFEFVDALNVETKEANKELKRDIQSKYRLTKSQLKYIDVNVYRLLSKVSPEKAEAYIKDVTARIDKNGKVVAQRYSDDYEINYDFKKGKKSQYGGLGFFEKISAKRLAKSNEILGLATIEKDKKAKKVIAGLALGAGATAIVLGSQNTGRDIQTQEPTKVTAEAVPGRNNNDKTLEDDKNNGGIAQQETEATVPEQPTQNYVPSTQGYVQQTQASVSDDYTSNVQDVKETQSQNDVIEETATAKEETVVDKEEETAFADKEEKENNISAEPSVAETEQENVKTEVVGEYVTIAKGALLTNSPSDKILEKYGKELEGAIGYKDNDEGTYLVNGKCFINDNGDSFECLKDKDGNITSVRVNGNSVEITPTTDFRNAIDQASSGASLDGYTEVNHVIGCKNEKGYVDVDYDGKTVDDSEPSNIAMWVSASDCTVSKNLTKEVKTVKVEGEYTALNDAERELYENLANVFNELKEDNSTNDVHQQEVQIDDNERA